MRSLWNGAFVIGRVTIPVSLHKAADHVDDVSLRTLHAKCNTPITTSRFCPTCDVELGPEDEMLQGFEFAPGQFVKVSRDELEEAVGGKRLDVRLVVPAGAITAPMLDRTYWVQPSSDPQAQRAYDALLRALQRTKRAGLGRIGIGSRERIAVVWPVTVDEVTVLGLSTAYAANGIRVQQMTEIRDAAAAAKASRADVTAFAELLETISTPGPWRTSQWYFPPRLRELLEAKQKKRGARIVAPQVDSIALHDLAEAIRLSAQDLATATTG